MKCSIGYSLIRKRATPESGALVMTFEPILAVRNVKQGSIPQTSADPRYVIVEVRTKTSMADFIELEMTRDAAQKMSDEIARFLNGDQEKWEPDDHD
jgi:hypothetical protein